MFDALTMRAVADELDAALTGGRIQRLGLTDARTLVLEVFSHGTRHQLLISDHPQHARIHLVPERLTADAARVTPFVLLLRKYVRGGRIVAITQPAMERTLAVSIVKAYAIVKDDEPEMPPASLSPEEITPDDTDDDDDIDAEFAFVPPPGWMVERTTLYVEIMGRHSNAILVNERGDIIDALKRVPSALSRVRPILPHLPYIPPPPQEKIDPRTVTAAKLRYICAVAGERNKLADALVGSLRGISPQIARELAYRAAGDAAVLATRCDPNELALALTALFRPFTSGQGWEPTRYLRDGVNVASSSAPLRMFADDPDVTAVPEPSMSAAVAHFFADTGRAVAHGERRERLLRSVADTVAKFDTRLAALRGELKRAEALETLRHKGEAIYAAAYEITPRQTQLVTEDGLVVALDPALTASENAQQYFEQYRKAQRAIEGVPERVAAAETERAYLAQITALIETATAFDDLIALEGEWKDYTHGTPSAVQSPGKQIRAHGRANQHGRVSPKGQRQPAVKHARAYLTPHGDRILVGRSGPQNEHLTFTQSRLDDLWLHARGVGGAHVIVQWDGGISTMPDASIETAARLAAYYSSAREAGRVEVDYAPRRQVRKIPGAGPGMVTYNGEHSLRVIPASVEELTAAGKLRDSRKPVESEE